MLALAALSAVCGLAVGLAEAAARRALIALLSCLLTACSPIVIAAQLVHLYLRLRLRPEERARAMDTETRFEELLDSLPRIVASWRARMERKASKWTGRGIVVVAGGERYGALATELVLSLREVGCELPIEVFHLGTAELACDAMAALAACDDNLTLRDLLSGHPALCDVAGYGYAAKPLALVASSFAEALLLDADNSVVDDPTALFEAPQYARHGAVFWCDQYANDETFVRLFDPLGVRQRPSRVDAFVQDALDRHLVSSVRIKPSFARAMEARLGLPAAHKTQESGQVLVDKRRCLDGLAATMVLNQNTQRPLVYRGLHGDKDTFRVGFAATGTPFHYPHASPPALGGYVDPRRGIFFDLCLIQPGLAGADEGGVAGVEAEPEPEWLTHAQVQLERAGGDAIGAGRGGGGGGGEARGGGGGPPPRPPPKPMFLHYCGRHRDDDAARSAGRPPTAMMSARGRPFRRWPFDGRRGYMRGVVEPFGVDELAAAAAAARRTAAAAATATVGSSRAAGSAAGTTDVAEALPPARREAMQIVLGAAASQTEAAMTLADAAESRAVAAETQLMTAEAEATEAMLRAQAAEARAAAAEERLEEMLSARAAAANVAGHARVERARAAAASIERAKPEDEAGPFAPTTPLWFGPEPQAAS